VTDPSLVNDHPRERRLTVARVRRAAAGTHVMFLEAARIYLLPADHPRHDALLRCLAESRDAGRAVLVRVTEDHGDVIDDVRK
jgi:3-methyladenine DNA glycosylase Mpg